MHPTIAQSGARLWSWRRDEKKRQIVKSRLLGTIHPDTVVAEYALDCLPNRDLERIYSGSVKEVRRVVSAAQRRVALTESLVAVHATPEPGKPIPRPTWILRERHRPAVMPGLVEPNPPPRSLAPMAVILSELEAKIAAGRHPYRALDWFRSVSGLDDWTRCAEILTGLGAEVDDGAVEMIARARRFWEQLAEFRRVYANAVRLRHVGPAEGDWAFVEAHEFLAWLPGLHVPKMQRRDAFLIRLFHRGGPLWDLDFHATSYRPLFGVPT